MTVPAEPLNHDVRENHGRAICGTERRGKGPCRLPAGWGTDHVGIGTCKLHLGTTARHNKHALTVMAAAMQADLTAKLVDRLATGERPAIDLNDSMAANLVIGQQVVEWLRDDVLPVAGAIDGAKPSVWLDRLAEQVAKQIGSLRLAQQSGYEERQVAVAEAQVIVAVRALEATLAELGVDVTAAKPIFAKHLRAIEAGSTEST